MPSPNYEDLFGGGAMAAHYALQDRDRDIAKHQSDLATAYGQQEAQSLANMYNQQMNPLKIQNQQFENEYTSQIQPIKINSELATFAKQAKQNELEMMEMAARKMALSNDPAESAEGVRLMGLTKEFYKLRELQESKLAVEDKKIEGRKEVEAVKAKLRPPKVSGSGGGAPKPLGMDKLHAQYTKEFLEADARGDTAAAEAALQKANAVAQQYGYRGRDTQAGTMRLGTGGLEPTPPRPAPQLPSASTTPKQTQKHSLAQVMQMYPGVPAEKVREAYKRKFGVDLQ